MLRETPQRSDHKGPPLGVKSPKQSSFSTPFCTAAKNLQLWMYVRVARRRQKLCLCGRTYTMPAGFGPFCRAATLPETSALRRDGRRLRLIAAADLETNEYRCCERSRGPWKYERCREEMTLKTNRAFR